MRKGKAAAAAGAVVLAVLLSGCAMAGLDPQTLMRPPRSTGERVSIHQGLEEKTNNRLNLQYPRRGDYRSAILMHDLSADGSEEAVGLYQATDTETGIVFMEGKNGKWKETGSFQNSASQVDKVCFGDVDRDGRDDVVVGWGNALNHTSSISIYSDKNGKISELSYAQPYSEFEVSDFDGDGYDEIFTAVVSTPEQAAIARLLRVTDNMVETIGSAHLDTGVTKYVGVTAGKINEKQYGIVLDGAKSGGNYVTEILYWDQKDKLLQAPFFDAGTLSANYTLRSTDVVSKDINHDSLIEIPIVNPLPGYTAPAPDETCYVTSWHRYDSESNTLVRAMSMVIDKGDGYWFLIPDMWRGKITDKLDRETRTLTFYEWLPGPGGKDGAVGQALLKIRAFSKKDWDGGTASAGFYKLEEQNAVVYAVSILQPDNALSLRLNDIQNSFKLISSQD